MSVYGRPIGCNSRPRPLRSPPSNLGTNRGVTAAMPLAAMTAPEQQRRFQPGQYHISKTFGVGEKKTLIKNKAVVQGVSST
jgi:hypothetical protein